MTSYEFYVLTYIETVVLFQEIKNNIKLKYKKHLIKIVKDNILLFEKARFPLARCFHVFPATDHRK